MQSVEININDLFANIKIEKKNALTKKNVNVSNDTEKISTINKSYPDISDNANENCKGCGSKNVFEVDGYNTCHDCGLYNDCVIDSGQEWRYYGADDSKGNDPARCDMPTNELLPRTSVGSFIGFCSKETYTTKRIRNMNYWNSIPYRESSLIETFNNITIMSQNAGISNCIIEEAKIMYKKVSDIKSSRRTKKEAMKAGCIMLACKLKGVPRNCSEIAKIFKLKNNKTLRKSMKIFEEIWNNIQMVEKNIKVEDIKTTSSCKVDIDSDSFDDNSDDDLFSNESEDDDTTDNSTSNSLNSSLNRSRNRVIKEYDSVKYLHRFCSILGIDDKIFEICKNILTRIEIEKYLEKHNPLSRTASVIYYVTERLDLKINKFNIVQTCEISDVTIIKCYQKLIRYKEIFNPYFDMNDNK
jgi:transcription initiation factor TFIIIB Brf1 subunit/transcription initiation factor TFIIB